MEEGNGAVGDIVADCDAVSDGVAMTVGEFVPVGGSVFVYGIGVRLCITVTVVIESVDAGLHAARSMPQRKARMSWRHFFITPSVWTPQCAMRKNSAVPAKP